MNSKDFGLFFMIFFTFLSSCIVTNRIGNLKVRGRIVSGEDALHRQFPFFAIIKRHPVHRFARGGASLISNEWVLTAAHVINELRSVAVIFGTIKQSNRSALSIISTHLYMHPGYVAGAMLYDIALIKLPKPVIFNSDIKPIALPTFSMANRSFVGASMIAMGFGHTSDNYQRKLPENLQFARMTVINSTECEARIKKQIPDSSFCANGLTCNGDSGGPAVIRDDYGKFMQIGIISFGYNRRCELPLPVGFTKITSLLRWINDATGVVES